MSKKQRIIELAMPAAFILMAAYVAVMAIFMAYDQASRRCPNLEFGTGVPEGVAAPESANNAVVASSMVPLLSLGVPGNSTSSLFLGALTIQGLRTGPTLFRDTCLLYTSRCV